MKARISVEVGNRAERRAMEAALQKPEVRAFVVVCGMLDALPTDRARERVLSFVSDALDEGKRGKR